jgi:hypothetical protein
MELLCCLTRTEKGFKELIAALRLPDKLALTALCRSLQSQGFGVRVTGSGISLTDSDSRRTISIAEIYWDIVYGSNPPSVALPR